MSHRVWCAVFTLVIAPFSLSAQNSITVGQEHSWGGTGTDIANAVATDSTRDVYVAGWATSYGAGGKDVLLLNQDPSGNLLRTRTWGGPGDDFAEGVTAASDGRVAATQSFRTGWDDVLVLKYDGSAQAGKLAMKSSILPMTAQ